ncbi:centromere protein U [Conger conger]|uniref:centromere protein U n=1 Tax=Conger conger TaxID=82655 RepID=UPI002A5A5CE1|nr:centromere protein U [Conger conger]XP_061107228.1 centromere protein U [Conger conger]XP_061107229.1 centromere protein U [Conger conger]XP_061107230.1 centromere protein U [Conger conger]XP_061107231.1 centromere protein U [Conger conger]
MSSKKSRMGKMLKNVQKELQSSGAEKARTAQKAQAVLPISPLDVSSIEKGSFFEDDEVLSYGNPLHSTAVEDDFSPDQGPKAKNTGAEARGPSRAETPKRPSRADKRQTSGKTSAPLSSTSSAPKGRQPRPPRKSIGIKSKTRALQRVSEGLESDGATGRRRRLSSLSSSPPSGVQSASNSDSGPGAQEPPPKRPRGAPQATLGARARAKKVPAPALPKNQPPLCTEGSISPLRQETGPSQSSVSGVRESSTEGQPPSRASAAAARRRHLSSLCSEDLTDEDPSWHEEPGRASAEPHVGEKRKPSRGRQNKVVPKRKSSSGSSGDAGPSGKHKHRERDTRNPIDLDVVLDAFLEFVSHYRETVDSAPVRQAIDAVSDMFEDQLTELITNTKELNSLKRENIKVNGTINKKRARLVEIKSELITKEAQLRSLQKEHGQLQERLTDLRTGTSFLSALRDLHKNYLAHRQRHPAEEEVYGPSSVPALLLEARRVLGAECQLKNINENLQQALEQANQH